LAGVMASTCVLAATPSNPATGAAPSEADWRTVDPRNLLVIDTNKGRILVELAPDLAPLTAARLRELAHEGFYDGRAFFRVIDDFMDQTGDPTDTGQGGSTKPNLPPEFTFRRAPSMAMTVLDKAQGLETGFIGAMPVISQTLDLAPMTADGKVAAYVAFCPGVVGMARAAAPDSGNSQFFLMRGTHPSLDRNYTALGRVISGLEVVKAIKTGEPVAPPMDTMTKVRVMADLPAAQRQTVRVIDTGGPWFRGEIERVRTQKVVGVSPCDLDVPAQVK
jgi:peptidylprolyl isomerase